ncbi:MAG: hypothetical protein AVDCRST_MAG54-1007, partial [uncultured Actinomycetospora sp.]
CSPPATRCPSWSPSPCRSAPPGTRSRATSPRRCWRRRRPCRPSWARP